MTEDENHAGSEGARVAREPDADEVRKDARARALRNLSLVALVAAVVLLLAFQAWNVVLIRGTQVDNRTTLTQAKRAATAAARTANRVEDCTTPGGDCFERAQRQTSGAVAGINTITVRAAACMTAILKQYPDGQQVNVDSVANQIQQCIKTASVTVTPQKVTPAPRSSLAPKQASGATAPKGPATHSGASPSPSAPASPAPAAPSPTTPAGALTDLTCRLAPILCPKP